MCDVKESDFWRMTDAQIWGVHYGYEMRKEQRSEDFRVLASIYVNSNCKEKVKAKDLWPLPYVDYLNEVHIKPITKQQQEDIIRNTNAMFAKMAESKEVM